MRIDIENTFRKHAFSEFYQVALVLTVITAMINGVLYCILPKNIDKSHYSAPFVFFSFIIVFHAAFLRIISDLCQVVEDYFEVIIKNENILKFLNKLDKNKPKYNK